MVVGRVEPFRVDAELANEPFRHRRIAAGRFQQHGAAVADHQAAADLKLVALGVAAEVVVVVQDQDFGGCAHGFPVEVGRREPADAAADHHQIKVLAGAGPGPARTVAQRMGDFKGTWVRTAHAGQRRRVVARQVLSAGILGLGGPRQQRGADGDTGPVQKVAAGDGRVHAKFPVAGAHDLAAWPWECRRYAPMPMTASARKGSKGQ